jgi:hypothetical protein
MDKPFDRLDVATVVDWVLEHTEPGSPEWLAAARLNNQLAHLTRAPGS